MTEMNRDDQPVIEFRRQANRLKLAVQLKGMLRGILADGRIGDQEALFLDTWLVQNSPSFDPALVGGDFYDAWCVTDSFLRNDEFSADLVSDAVATLNDIIEYSDKSEGDDLINELLGLACGVVTDGTVNDLEIRGIQQWIQDHPSLRDVWPVSAVGDLLDSVLLDDVIDDSERAEVHALLSGLAGSSFLTTGAAEALSADFFLDDVNDLAGYAGCQVCFTGKSVTLRRADLRDDASGRGFQVSDNISKKVRIVVVGLAASRDWRFTSFGRKIEKALKLKAEGQDILIIGERSWMQLRDHSSGS